MSWEQRGRDERLTDLACACERQPCAEPVASVGALCLACRMGWCGPGATKPRTEGVHYVRAFEDALTAAGLERFQREPWYNPRTGRRDGRVLGEYVVRRWRVGPGFWDRYIRPVVDDPNLVITYGGAPIEVDERLAPEGVEMEFAGAERRD